MAAERYSLGHIVYAALRVTSLCALFFANPLLLSAQTLKYSKPPNARNGEHTFKSGCIACHGSDGTGTPQTTAGFERPNTFPDFTKCDQTTPEPNSVWKGVIVHGGLARGFSQIILGKRKSLRPAHGTAFDDAGHQEERRRGLDHDARAHV